MSFDDFTSQICSNISDPSLRRNLINELAFKLKQCCSLHETAKRALLGEVGRDVEEDCQNSDHELGLEDGASQVIKLPSNLITSTDKSFARRIETDCKHAELRATFDSNLVKLKAKAKAAAATAAEADAEVKAAKAKKQMLLEEVKLDAEENLYDKSRDNLSVISCKFQASSIVAKTDFLYKPCFNGKNLRNMPNDVLPCGGDTYTGLVPTETEPKVLFPAVARLEVLLEGLIFRVIRGINSNYSRD